MADLSSSSNLMALEGLPKDLCKDIIKSIPRHYYQRTEQGVIMMEIDSIIELRMYDLPKHSKSTSNLISGLLTFVDDLLNIKNSVDLIHINQELVCEKPPIDMPNPCEILANCDVVGQETSGPSVAKIVDPKSPSKSIEGTSSTSMLEGATKQRQQGQLHCAV
jgi:hypothetical protein